ncbi:MAG: hypothetical protein GY929_22540 [Actinomycetia bacterium]|nr:hypothetical protein [Actinomycetes bacterium]
MRRTVMVALLLLALAASGCSSDSEGSSGENPDAEEVGSDDLWPDVIGATLEQTAPGVFRVSATLSSPYDSPGRYADGWRVVGPDGTVFGERPLAHDHAGEQPFTRSVSGVEIPADVIEVTIEGRDQVSGWGGATVTLDVPHGGG